MNSVVDAHVLRTLRESRGLGQRELARAARSTTLLAQLLLYVIRCTTPHNIQ